MTFLLLALLACTPASKPDDTAVPDTVDTPDTVDPVDPVTDVAWALHPDIATVVQVTWTQDVPADAAWVTFSLDDGTASSTPARHLAAGPQSAYLFGIPADTDVTFAFGESIDEEMVEIRDDRWTATTGPLPETLPVPDLISYDSSRANPDPYLLYTVDTGSSAYAGPWWITIVDRQARVVWYYAVPERRLAVTSRPSFDGTHIAWGEAAWEGNPPSIERATLDLGYRKATETPGIGFTFDEWPDGTFSYDYWTPERMGIDTAAPDGVTTHVWDCITEWLPAGRSVWDCGTNTVNWSEDRGTWLYSLYDADTVIEVDPDLGAVGSWGMIGEDPLLPEGTGLQRQHYPNWTADGTLILQTQQVGEERVEWDREFAWDPATNALEEIWSYAASDVYADCSGEAVRLDDGNTLLNYGCNQVIREITPDGTVAWEVKTHGLVGHQTLLTDLYALNEGPAASR